MHPDEARELIRAGTAPFCLEVDGDLDLSESPDTPEEFALKQLPLGLHVKGDLLLMGCTQLVIMLTVEVDGTLCAYRCERLAHVEEVKVGSVASFEHCYSLRKLAMSLSFGGDLILSHCESLSELPKGLTVGGTLKVDYCEKLEALPPNLQVKGHLYARSCTSLKRVGKGISIGGYANFYGNTALTSLPADFTVPDYLSLGYCTSLKKLPKNLRTRDLTLDGCTALKQIPADTIVEASISCVDCSSLEKLPPNLRVNLDLWLNNCTSLRKLPDGLHVTRGLLLLACSALKELPKQWSAETLYATGDSNTFGWFKDNNIPCSLALYGADVEALPSSLHVMGNLEINAMTALKQLPAQLDVLGDLSLIDCSALTTLPENLCVRGDLTIRECNALQTLPDSICVERSLNIECNQSLKALPDGLKIGSDLVIRGSDNLQELPKGLNVGGTLTVHSWSGIKKFSKGTVIKGNVHLADCSEIKTLPSDLHVGGSLFLRGSGITKLPKGLTVGGDIDVRGRVIRGDKTKSQTMKGVAGKIIDDKFPENKLGIPIGSIVPCWLPDAARAELDTLVTKAAELAHYGSQPGLFRPIRRDDVPTPQDLSSEQSRLLAIEISYPSDTWQMRVEPFDSYDRGFWAAVHDQFSEAREKNITMDREGFTKWVETEQDKFCRIVWWDRIIMRPDRPRSELPEYVQELHAEREVSIPKAFPLECSTMTNRRAQRAAAKHSDWYGRLNGSLAAFRVLSGLLTQDAKNTIDRFPDRDT